MDVCKHSSKHWWSVTQYFGLRGRQKHHSMTAEDFSFGSDENNTTSKSSITPQKTRRSRLSPKRRSFLLETRGVPSQFLKRSSPPEMLTTGPLYLSCMLSLVKAAAHRSKQINHMMKSVIKGTTLEDSLNTQPHRLENCCRDFEDSWSKAMFNFKVTVHRNKSLDDYGEGDETEQRTSA